MQNLQFSLYLIFPADPLNAKLPDTVYKNEYEAAKAANCPVYLVSLEALLESNNAQDAVQRIPSQTHLITAMYRGWMLKPAMYAALYISLLEKNIQLINSPEHYIHCHYLPESYEIIEHMTAKTIWFSKSSLDCDADSVLQKIKHTFGCNPIIIKDYVKSRKHEWQDACFIENACDSNNLTRVLSNFLQRQGTALNEGVVFREFLKLAFLTNHSKSNMPLTKEFRLFFMQGKLLQTMYYWDEGSYEDIWPNFSIFQPIANKVKSNFFTMDIALTIDGQWKIIELGDGQVSGLPDNVNLYEFYAKIKHANESVC